MAEYALRLINSQDTAARVRMGDALRLQHKGPLNSRSGLRPDGGGVVTVVAGTMGVQVTKFLGWVDGGASDAQGGYPFVLDADKVLTVADGHASLVRTDTIAAVVKDDVFDASGVTSASVTIVQGTPGAGAPALPTNAVALRDVVVPAGLSAGTGGLASGHLGTDRRQYLAAGFLPVTGTTDRDALTSVQTGQHVYRLDTKELQVWNGTAWDTYAKKVTLPAFVGERSTQQSIPNGSITAITGLVASHSVGGMSYAAGEVTVPAAGLYAITGLVGFEDDATGTRYLYIYRNTTQLMRVEMPALQASDTITTLQHLAAGDKVSVRCYQASGSSLLTGSVTSGALSVACIALD